MIGERSGSSGSLWGRGGSSYRWGGGGRRDRGGRCEGGEGRGEDVRGEDLRTWTRGAHFGRCLRFKDF